MRYEIIYIINPTLKCLRKTYSDLKIRIIRQHLDNDFVISEIITEGTHLGVWLGIKPSGKNLVFTGVNIDRVIDNKVGVWQSAGRKRALRSAAIGLVGKEILDFVHLQLPKNFYLAFSLQLVAMVSSPEVLSRAGRLFARPHPIEGI
jgi:hypothetical protein